MAITPQQARAKALQLRAERPELQNMAVDDLISQIIATEGMGAPGAGGNLANLFPAKLVTPASPAPMQAARLQAPKPTADIVPGADVDAYRSAQEIRERTERGPAPEERAAANSRVQELIAGLPTGAGERAPVVAAAMPAAAPAKVAEAAPEAAPEKPKFQSRYRPLLEQKQAELQQKQAEITATTPAGGAPPPVLSYELKILSGEIRQLNGLVAAEEGAVVDAERAAVLERQTQRLGREEELIDRTRRLAPGTALMEFGAALAGAKPGEKFASALARGLQAGSESYTGARDAREAALRGIEEKRDALALQTVDAIQKARDRAIEIQNAGGAMSEQQMRLANMSQEGATNLALAPFKLRVGKAEASKAETEAEYAPRVFDADLAYTRARTVDALRPPASSGSGGTGTLSPTQAGLRAKEAKQDLEKIEERIIASEEEGTHSLTYDLLTEYANARTAFNNAAIVAGRSPITTTKFPTNLPNFNKYLKERQAKRGKPAVTGGQSRPAGVGPDWKLEKDSKGNRAWVNPSRTKFVEIR
jgi:hypothetical protein